MERIQGCVGWIATCCLLGVLAARATSLCGQQAAEPPIVSPGDSVSIAVHPRELQKVRIALAGKKFNELKVDVGQAALRGVFVKAILEIPGQAPSDPFIADDGESFVRIPSLPEQDAQASLNVTVLNQSKSDVAPVAVSIQLTVSPVTDENTRLSDAFLTFAHAERLRREHKTADEAVPFYDRAYATASQLHDQPLMQLVLMSKARFLLLDGQHYAQALDIAQQAVSIPANGDSPIVAAMAWKTLGIAYVDLDRYQESVEASKKALPLLRQIGSRFWENIVLENLGDAYRASGDLENARATDEDDLRLARELKDDYGVIEMLSELGGIDESLGEYQAALDFYLQAVEIILPSGYNTVQGEAWANLGSLYRILHDDGRALAAYEKALGIARNTKDRQLELGALEERGDLELDHGDAEAAAADFSQGLTMAHDVDLVRPQCRFSIGLARADSNLKKFDAARQLLAAALEISQRLQLVEEQAAATQVGGELAEAQGDWNTAIDDFKMSASLWEQAPDRWRQVAVLTKLATTEYQHDELDPAHAHLDQAMTLIEASRGNISRGALRVQYFASQRRTYDLAIRVLMQMDKKNPDQGYAAAAWQVSERARARSLLDDLASAPTRSNSTRDDSLTQRAAALDHQVQNLRDQLTSLGSGAGDAAKAKSISVKIHAALQEQDQIESRVAVPDLAPARAPALDAHEFSTRTLTRGTALLEYWMGEQSAFLWILTDDGRCRAFSLDRNRIEDQVSAFHQALAARVGTPREETLEQRASRTASADMRMHDRLLDLADLTLPAGARKILTGLRSLVVVADGPLLSIPFSALPAGPRSTYLIEGHEVVSEPSAAALAAFAHRGAQLQKEGTRIAVFADPVYSRNDGRFVRASAEPPSGQLQRSLINIDFTQLPRLPGSLREAEAIDALAGEKRAKLFLGFDATPAAVVASNQRNYSIVHFAAHIVSRPDYPELSGIVLSMVDPEGRSRDGVLWLKDIYQLHADRKLVVLSGCDSATGAFIPGEGVNGLVRAFLVSGSRQVLATLWAADDSGSSSLMTAFYQAYLPERLSASAALRQAQLALLNTKGRSAPYYWAGFQVEGAWQTH